MMQRQAKGWQPEPGQWLVFRTDTQVQAQSVDIYVMLQIPSLYCYGFFLVPGMEPNEKDVKQLLQKAFRKDGSWPHRLTLPKGDPAESVFRKFAEPNKVSIDTQPMALLEPFARPFKEDFGKFAISPSGMVGSNLRDAASPEDKESAEAGIPDSYDPCPCASGKKYKFCCKRIFHEVIMAMCAAEEGHPNEALKWMAKAQAIAGETAEVLCRYAIVYSHFDKTKSNEYLEKCLHLFPKYARAYYIRGVELKENGKHEEALSAYQKAIDRYPPTDKYHLNEVWNNVGTMHHEQGRHEEAKSAWERALVYLPSDRIVKNNLIEFIYTNPTVPETLREPSPFVAHFMEALEGKQ